MTMTIFDLAPVIFGSAVIVAGYTVCKIGHDRAVAARDRRRALAVAADRTSD